MRHQSSCNSYHHICATKHTAYSTVPGGQTTGQAFSTRCTYTRWWAPDRAGIRLHQSGCVVSGERLASSRGAENPPSPIIAELPSPWLRSLPPSLAVLVTSRNPRGVQVGEKAPALVAGISRSCILLRRVVSSCMIKEWRKGRDGHKGGVTHCGWATRIAFPLLSLPYSSGDTVVW